MLLITIVCGLAANIGLVLVVGLGVLIVHVIHSSPNGFWGRVDTASVVGTCAIANVLLICLFAKKRPPKGTRFWYWQVCWIGVIVLAVAVTPGGNRRLRRRPQVTQENRASTACGRRHPDAGIR
jgi:multisubunit Na+/H+ antiporter MnhB subunit